MQIPSIGAKQICLNIQRASASGSSGNFTRLLALAGRSDAGTSPGSIGGSRSNGAAKPDFRNMTSATFKAQAQAMYDRGEIDLTALGVMQLAGNTDEMDVTSSSKEIDFTARIKSLMDFEVTSGHRTNSLSPYKIYENILAKIAPRTGANLVG